MILHRLYDDELAQATYLIGCERTHQAIVVDPSLDLDRVLTAARDAGLHITDVIETHIHADFVSGSRALAAETGATLHLSGEGGPDWTYVIKGVPRVHLLHDGDAIDVGTVRLTAMHTPGHTPEHLAYLVTDTAVSPEPVGMLSGDFIFVGDVGRPDLLERAAHIAGTMEQSARQLYASLQRTRALGDGLQIWPGHGAGSACGKSLGAMPQSTLGYERLVNRALRRTTENDFVRDILRAQPEPPRYFARMKTVNRDGAPNAARQAPPCLDARGVDAAAANGAMLVDTRPSAAFVNAHVPKSICVPKSKSFTTYFGAAAPDECPVVLLVGNESDLARLQHRLHLIGFDRIVGWASAEEILAERRAAGLPVASLTPITIDATAKELGGKTAPMLLDVRNAGERELGIVPGAREIALSQLDAWATTAEHGNRPIVVHCQGGTRAIIGASLLRAHGFDDVRPMAGGFAGWASSGHAVTDPASS